MAWRWLAAAVALVGAAGCEALFPLGEYGPPAPDAAVAPAPDAAACPDDAGSAMVSLGTFCIDATEVTVAQYAAFLAAKGRDVGGQPSVCAWNSDYTPSAKCGAFPPANREGPVACVDWCDAFAYCSWAGKRLCGAIDGGPSSVARGTVAGGDAWFTACSRDGGRRFSYGDTYDPSACNTTALGRGGTVTVRSLPKCVGGYEGIFDMIGNVAEWTDNCDSTNGIGDTCRPRGGSFENVLELDECAKLGAVGRESSFTDLGIRCCAP